MNTNQNDATDQREFFIDVGSVRMLRVVTDGANAALAALDAPGSPYAVTDSYGLFSPDGTRMAIAECSYVTVSGGPGETRRWDPWREVNDWYQGTVEWLVCDHQPRSVRYAPLWLTRYTLAAIEVNGKSANVPGTVLAALGFQPQRDETSDIRQAAERYDDAHIEAVIDLARKHDTTYLLRRATHFHVSYTTARQIISAVGRHVSSEEIQAWTKTETDRG